MGRMGLRTLSSLGLAMGLLRNSAIDLSLPPRAERRAPSGLQGVTNAAALLNGALDEVTACERVGARKMLRFWQQPLVRRDSCLFLNT